MNGVIGYLNSTGEAFAGFAGRMLLQSSILILVLLCLDILLRRRGRAVSRYCVWMLVLIKLLLPTSL